MGNEMQRFEQPATAVEIRAQVNLVQEVMQAVMKEGEHYGIIPGCPKPSLYQPGAEKLAMTFRLIPGYETERVELAGGHREYVAKCKLTGAGGNFLGEAVASCSTMEKKYRFYQDGTERENLADVYNTTLQMAQKRAFVRAIRCCTAASDIFTQDIEDMDDVGDQAGKKKSVSQPKRKSESADGSGLVENIGTKTGEKNGKPWIKYTITIGGVAYSTFDKALAEKAENSKLEGLVMKPTWTDSQWGRNLTGLDYLAAPPAPEPPKAAPAQAPTPESAPLSTSPGELPGMGTAPTTEDLVSMVTDQLMLPNDGSGGTYTPEVAQGRLDELLKDCKMGKLKLDNLAAAIKKNPSLASALMDAAAAKNW